MRRTSIFIALPVTLVMATAGCVGDPALDESTKISAAIYDKLRQSEGVGSAVIDFDQVVSGDWDRMTVVCPGYSASDLDRVLGFTWENSAWVEKAQFVGMLVFSANDHVQTLVDIGSDSYSDGFYFLPCPAVRDAADGYPAPYTLPRSDSELTFEFLRSDDQWVVPVSGT